MLLALPVAVLSFGFTDVLGLLSLVVVLAAFMFWIRMLFHCARSPNPSKVIWFLVILFGNVVGALIYYFAQLLPRRSNDVTS